MAQSKSEPLITIAIPFYNAEAYLSLAIESVIKQTYTHWVLLLIDDGSTDNSIKIAKKYENLDKRIKVYSDGKNKNLAYRLNEIAKLSDTKYLARMDADDIMHPLRLQKQIETLEKHPEIDVLGTNAYSIDENNNVVGIRMDPNCGYLVDVHHFIHPTIMAKTEWFKNNPYDVKAIRLEDAELWFRTKNMNTFKMLSEPLFFYREFSGSYFKKYWKGYKTVFYLNKKYKFSKPFVGWIFTTPITILIYFLFEQVLKSDKLNLRRNVIVFKSRKIVEI